MVFGQMFPFPYLTTTPPTQRSPQVFYFKSTGNNSNTGTDTTNAWQSLDRLTTVNLVPGDSIRFKGGDSIKGSCQLSDINFASSSARIVFRSYGSGRSTIILDTAGTKSIYLLYAQRIKIQFSALNFKGRYNTLTFTGGTSTSTAIYIYNINKSSTIGGDSTNVVIDSCDFTKLQNGVALDVNSYYKRGTYLITSSKFHDIALSGIFISGIVYSNCIIRNNEFENITGLPTIDYSGVGVSFLWCRNTKVERNYFNRIDRNSKISAAAIYYNSGRNNIVQYNEIRNVYRSASNEAVGVYFDCGSDSNVAQYNFIQNVGGFGIQLANAPSSFCGYPTTFGLMPGFVEDTLEASYNIARYNIIKCDSGGLGGVTMYSEPGSYGVNNPQKRNMIYNNLIYVKRGRRLNSADNIRVPTAINQFGRSDSVYIYNNIFVLDSAIAMRMDSIAYLGSARLVNAVIRNNLYYFITSPGAIIEQRTKFFNVSPFYWIHHEYTTLSGWADSTGYEKSGASYTYINSNPLINNLTVAMYGTSYMINPNFLDTLTNFKYSNVSPAINAGTNYNNEATRISANAIIDWFNTTLPVGAYDLGIYEKP